MNQPREYDGSGRYRADEARLCRCGCPQGEHLALAAKPCMSCPCERFRLALRPKPGPAAAEIEPEG